MSNTSTPTPVTDYRAAKIAQRKLVNRIMLGLSMLAMAFGVFWLLWILLDTIRLGLGGLSMQALTAMTPGPNEAGGIANAMFGSFLMVLVATFIGTPIGVMAGIYLAEYDQNGWVGKVTRFVNDILLSSSACSCR